MIDDTDINKIIVLTTLGKNVFQYFNSYKDKEENEPLSIMVPIMSGYRKIFNETKYMSLLIKDHVLLQKCNKIWNKVSNSIKNYNGVVHSEKYLKTRTKSYEGKITTNFHYDETTKRGSHCICLSAI